MPTDVKSTDIQTFNTNKKTDKQYNRTLYITLKADITIILSLFHRPNSYQTLDIK